MKKTSTFLICLFSLFCNADMLLWQVNSDSVVHGPNDIAEIAWSGLYSSEFLAQNGSYVLSDDAMQIVRAWIPADLYTTKPVPKYDESMLVPEPNAMILALFGIASILLKRENNYD